MTSAYPSEAIKRQIESNAAEIVRLHQRIRDTVRWRAVSSAKRDEWSLACTAFHRHFDELSFPGGYEGVDERLMAGDPETMEAAICFLEVRPYFFRSGYMFDHLIRKTRHAPLSEEQRMRWQGVYDKREAWRAARREATQRVASLSDQGK